MIRVVILDIIFNIHIIYYTIDIRRRLKANRQIAISN